MANYIGPLLSADAVGGCSSLLRPQSARHTSPLPRTTSGNPA
jgi:hypothetical protein